MKNEGASYQKQPWIIFSAALILIASGAIARIWMEWIQPLSDKPVILCLFRRMTHLPCPFCGTTRTLAALSRGELISAFLFNPLACTLFILTLSTALFLLFYLPFQKEKKIQLWPKNGSKYTVKISLLLILANWIYLVWYHLEIASK